MQDKNLNHVMIDLETLGTKCDSPVIAIGAVQFSPDTGDIGGEFYTRIDWASAIEGRKADPETLKWWLKQSHVARAEIIKNGAKTPEALQALNEFIAGLTTDRSIKDIQVWGNGSTFDIGILENVYDQYRIFIPWKFWNVRDCRTVEEMARGFVSRKAFARAGVRHNALDDALYQVKYVSAMWKAVRAGLVDPFG